MLPKRPPNKGAAFIIGEEEKRREEKRRGNPKNKKLRKQRMRGASTSKDTEMKSSEEQKQGPKKQKPQFRPAKDDTKPVLRDPILRSDPIETEEAVLRLPPFPFPGTTKCPNAN